MVVVVVWDKTIKSFVRDVRRSVPTTRKYVLFVLMRKKNYLFGLSLINVDTYFIPVAFGSCFSKIENHSSRVLFVVQNFIIVKKLSYDRTAEAGSALLN